MKPDRRAKAGCATVALPVVDSPEARSRALLAAMLAFRDGDFSVRLPAYWEGTDGRIADAFNQAVAHEDRVAREVGTEGKLGGQAQVPGVAGTWKDRTDSVNAMATNLTARAAGGSGRDRPRGRRISQLTA